MWFVTIMKDNAIFHVTKVMVDNTRKKDAQGVLKEQYVTIVFPRKILRSIEKPLDDRNLVQTVKAALPAEVLLGGDPQCYQDADILRTDGLAADGGDQEKVGDEEVVRQHDHRDQDYT